MQAMLKTPGHHQRDLDLLVPGRHPQIGRLAEIGSAPARTVWIVLDDVAVGDLVRPGQRLAFGAGLLARPATGDAAGRAVLGR